MKTHSNLSYLSLACSMLLTACGSGGSSSNNDVTKDLPVTVSFSCELTSSDTDSDVISKLDCENTSKNYSSKNGSFVWVINNGATQTTTDATIDLGTDNLDPQDIPVELTFNYTDAEGQEKSAKQEETISVNVNYLYDGQRYQFKIEKDGVDNLEAHYQKHVVEQKEFSYTSQEQYLDHAHLAMKEAEQNGKTCNEIDSNNRLYLNPTTCEFVVAVPIGYKNTINGTTYKDNTLRSYYKLSGSSATCVTSFEKKCQ